MPYCQVYRARRGVRRFDKRKFYFPPTGFTAVNAPGDRGRPGNRYPRDNRHLLCPTRNMTRWVSEGPFRNGTPSQMGSTADDHLHLAGAWYNLAYVIAVDPKRLQL